MDVTLGILQCILICACRERLARMFTDDKQVLYLVQTIVSWLPIRAFEPGKLTDQRV